MGRHATRHNKRDSVEPSIIAVLEAMGVEWVEAGPLDGWGWIAPLGWVPIECKSGPQGKLTPGQLRFTNKCILAVRPYLVLRSPEDAEHAVNALRRSRG